MNWRTVLNTNNRHYEGITVSPYKIYLTTSLLAKMGNPKKVAVFFDSDRQAIAFTPNPEDRPPTHSFPIDYHNRVSINIGNLMPHGRYIYADADENRFICLLVPVHE